MIDESRTQSLQLRLTVTSRGHGIYYVTVSSMGTEESRGYGFLNETWTMRMAADMRCGGRASPRVNPRRKATGYDCWRESVFLSDVPSNQLIPKKYTSDDSNVLRLQFPICVREYAQANASTHTQYQLKENRHQFEKGRGQAWWDGGMRKIYKYSSHIWNFQKISKIF